MSKGASAICSEIHVLSSSLSNSGESKSTQTVDIVVLFVGSLNASVPT